MIAIVYSRVSGEEQARTGFSLPSQSDAGSRRARELGATEVLTFADEGVPGDVLERPGLQEALEVVRRGGVDYFICFDPDRLARNLSLQLVVTEQVEKAGTKIDFVNFEYKHTPEGQLFYALRGAIAQFEREKIRERTQRGKRQKALAGRMTNGARPYGYTFDPLTDSLSIDDARASFVQMVFNWFLEEDLGPWTVAERLTQLGIPTPRGGANWDHTTVRYMLRNEAYIGKLVQQRWDTTDMTKNKYRAKGEKVKRRVRPEADWQRVTIPPIIDEATFSAVQAKLENARRWWSGWHVESYLLSGLGECALCGRPIYGASRQTCKRRIRYYVCRGYAPGVKGEPRCAFGRVHADQVEEEVWREVSQIILTPGKLQDLFGEQVDQSNVQAEVDLLLKRMTTLQSEHDRTTRLVVKGTISESVGEQLLAEQNQQLAAIKAQLAKLQSQLANSSLIVAQMNSAEQLRQQYQPIVDELDFAERQRAVRAFVKKVVLSRDETVVKVRLAPIQVTS